MSGESKREPMFSANQKSGYTPWVQGALKEWNIDVLNLVERQEELLTMSGGAPDGNGQKEGCTQSHPLI